ncbi:hypothetical protein [Rhizobium sp. NZLR11]|uniref:hypothetical protein n=1 Tax=Rhizobium sp. NZLR11 TaxID=2731098 RepID=UPI001C82F16B|nr:hypothetical protein [Rhizobium sp. NZLR11]MBX5210515.1 hypothetical protein [Rhizobium sp. NZLR11]
MDDTDQTDQEARVICAAGFSWIDIGPPFSRGAFGKSPAYALYKASNAILISLCAPVLNFVRAK